jgi:hypothetical protein
MKTALLFGLDSLQIGIIDEINSEVHWVLREKKKKLVENIRETHYIWSTIFMLKNGKLLDLNIHNK